MLNSVSLSQAMEVRSLDELAISQDPQAIEGLKAKNDEKAWQVADNFLRTTSLYYPKISFLLLLTLLTDPSLAGKEGP